MRPRLGACIGVCVGWRSCCSAFFFFFFNDTATTEIYTLSLHDALPIWPSPWQRCSASGRCGRGAPCLDRKSTRLNSSHTIISYAVFCLKKKKINTRGTTPARALQRSTPKRCDHVLP